MKPLESACGFVFPFHFMQPEPQLRAIINLKSSTSEGSTMIDKRFGFGEMRKMLSERSIVPVG